MPIIGKGAVVRVTERLRLEPITDAHAEDYLVVFGDDAIAQWYGGKPTREEAQHAVDEAERIWNTIGFHKWLVYDREGGQVVGRGGLSAMRLHAYDDAIRSSLPAQPWADEQLDDNDVDPLARRWAEIGWALRGEYWGRGYATEVGRCGLQVAFEELGMQAVVSFTERHNRHSRAVMERIGMRYAGEFVGSGLIEGRGGIHAEAPFSLYVALRDTWRLKG